MQVAVALGALGVRHKSEQLRKTRVRRMNPCLVAKDNVDSTFMCTLAPVGAPGVRRGHPAAV
jgi:hypothetical protein